jgi:hypothetical protein
MALLLSSLYSFSLIIMATTTVPALRLKRNRAKKEVVSNDSSNAYRAGFRVGQLMEAHAQHGQHCLVARVTGFPTALTMTLELYKTLSRNIYVNGMGSNARDEITLSMPLQVNVRCVTARYSKGEYHGWLFNIGRGSRNCAQCRYQVFNHSGYMIAAPATWKHRVDTYW